MRARRKGELASTAVYQSIYLRLPLGAPKSISNSTHRAFKLQLIKQQTLLQSTISYYIKCQLAALWVFKLTRDNRTPKRLNYLLQKCRSFCQQSYLTCQGGPKDHWPKTVKLHWPRGSVSGSYCMWKYGWKLETEVFAVCFSYTCLNVEYNFDVISTNQPCSATYSYSWHISLQRPTEMFMCLWRAIIPA